jgi:hypothetical protein
MPFLVLIGSSFGRNFTGMYFFRLFVAGGGAWPRQTRLKWDRQ